MQKQNKNNEDPTAHAEKEINEFFYDEKQEDEGHPTDYMNNGMASVNIAKSDDDK